MILSLPGPPLPPAGIQSTPTSSCQANINLTVYQSDSNYTFSDSDRYIIQIQYVITDVGSLEWVKLLEGDTTLHSVRILFGGGNTMYMLRGRGLNGTWGEGQNSDVFGPFIAYRNDKIPTPTSVRAYPIDVLSLQVTWNSMDECYQFINFTVVCLKDGASSDNEVHITPLGVVSMAVVPGLEEDVYYTCHVLGRVVVMGESVGGAVREVQINSSASVRSFTYPKGKYQQVTLIIKYVPHAQHTHTHHTLSHTHTTLSLTHTVIHSPHTNMHTHNITTLLLSAQSHLVLPQPLLGYSGNPRILGTILGCPN